MSLRIAHFVTRIKTPRQFEAQARVVERVIKERFATDLAAHLGPSLSRQPEIVRIRRLNVKLSIAPSDLNEAALSRRWTLAFGEALFKALAYPDGLGPIEVFRAESPTIFIANAVRDLTNGTTAGHWEYAEFEPVFRLGSVQGAIALLCNWTDQTLPVLQELERVNALNRLLGQCDDLALERLFKVLAPSGDIKPSPLAITDLIRAARLILEHPPEAALSLNSRRYALRLFVHSRISSAWPHTPRVVFHALGALRYLLELGVPLHYADFSSDSIKDLPSSVSAVLEEIRQIIYPNGAISPAVSSVGNREAGGVLVHKTGSIAELIEALDALRAVVPLPPRARRSKTAVEIASDWCGLFWLSSTLERLAWAKSWSRLPQFQLGGISCLIAGLSLSITGQFETMPRGLDRGVALFSGYQGEPDLQHLRKLFAQDSPATRMDILNVAQIGGALDDAVVSWEATFNALADVLIQSIADRIRGFRKASRSSIVRSFLRRPGRILVDDELIRVAPDPSPFNIALHISSLDGAVESVFWLGGRRLEFQLEDV